MCLFVREKRTFNEHLFNYFLDPGSKKLSPYDEVCKVLIIPGNAVQTGSVFASRDPASFPSADDDVRPAPVPRRDEETSVYSGPCRVRALFTRHCTINVRIMKVGRGGT